MDCRSRQNYPSRQTRAPSVRFHPLAPLIHHVNTEGKPSSLAYYQVPYLFIHEGRLSGEAVSLVVRERVAAVGLDPRRSSGQSLRAGLATSAAQVGAPSRRIRAQTRRLRRHIGLLHPRWEADWRMQLGLCSVRVRNLSTGAWQKLSIMSWILLVIALLRGVARVDVQSPGHKLRSGGPTTWFPPIGRS
jgi:hypothetical protein